MDERAQAMLAFERMSWRDAATKAEAIRRQFGMSAARYVRLLDAALDSPDCLRADPELVYRLRRLRAERESRRPGLGVSARPSRAATSVRLS